MITDRLVALAVANFDPEEHEKREDRGQASWDTKINHPNPTDFDGTSDLGIRGDTLTLKGFYDLLGAIAHQLHLDGAPPAGGPQDQSHRHHHHPGPPARRA